MGKKMAAACFRRNPIEVSDCEPVLMFSYTVTGSDSNLWLAIEEAAEAHGYCSAQTELIQSDGEDLKVSLF